MTFSTLPMAKKSDVPAGLSLEKPANNLASLSMTGSMRALMTNVIKQWHASDAFLPLADYGIGPVRQLLFYGPPGNGKTSACQWIARQLSVPLYRIQCDELIASHLGETSSNVRRIMDWIANTPSAVILFDEIESLFPARPIESTACTREIASAMTVYWQHLDRWTGKHLFVAATNLPAALDSALVSRFEYRLEFPAPTEDQCRDVIAYWSEILHAYGADKWRPKLESCLDHGELPTSFRALWQGIRDSVVSHVVSPMNQGSELS
jgi:hypothetical protein